jgi:NAD(P)H-flavin reductase
VGVVPGLLEDAPFDPARTTAFVCGPEIMMHFAAEALLARGVPAERIKLSMERHMDCGIGLCGHCQLGPTLICRDGPVYTQAELAPWLEVAQL